MEAAETILKPQPGPQTDFLRCRADICVFGGACGGGKSFGLHLEHCYHIKNPGYRGATFRRTTPQLRAPGGLWDKSKEIYPLLGAEPREQTLEWRFPSGAIVKFGAIELDADVYSWDGSEICGLFIDEGTQFSEFVFWHLTSRNRSTCGIKPYIRITCNPDPDSWVKRFISYWIDETTGYPITERCGKLRWFVRRNDELFWADSPQELIENFGSDAMPKSVTFIPSFVQNNPALLKVDPGYIANLMALPEFEKNRLLLGDWNARPQAGSYFKRAWFGTPLENSPGDIVGRVRFVDRAGSEQAPGRDPDATVLLKLAKTRQGLYIIEDVVRIFVTPHQVEAKMIECAKADGVECVIGFMTDPGSAGKYESTAASRALDGFVVKIIPSSGAGSKEVRARPISSQCEAGNVKIVRAPWNEQFLRELEAFPFGRHDDCIDALSGGHAVLSQSSGAVLDARMIHLGRQDGSPAIPGFVPRTFTPRMGLNQPASQLSPQEYRQSVDVAIKQRFG